MIYASGEKLLETDCDIIVHECFCKKEERNKVNEIMFGLYKQAQEAHEKYKESDIEKINTLRLSVVDEKKIIVINMYSKLNKKITNDKGMSEMNIKNFNEATDNLFEILKGLKEKKTFKVGYVNSIEKDGRNKMELWEILFKKSMEYNVDVHLLEL